MVFSWVVTLLFKITFSATGGGKAVSLQNSWLWSGGSTVLILSVVEISLSQQRRGLFTFPDTTNPHTSPRVHALNLRSLLLLQCLQIGVLFVVVKLSEKYKTTQCHHKSHNPHPCSRNLAQDAPLLPQEVSPVLDLLPHHEQVLPHNDSFEVPREEI